MDELTMLKLWVWRSSGGSMFIQ